MTNETLEIFLSLMKCEYEWIQLPICHVLKQRLTANPFKQNSLHIKCLAMAFIHALVEVDS
jgi:hypothetical protein